MWVISAILALLVSFCVKEDLRRLQLDDVKNSEYIEEEEVRRQSFEQREVFLKEAGLDNDLKFKFEFQDDALKPEVQ
jgi:hypothetical protein